MNQWTDFFYGLIDAGSKVAGALYQKSEQTDLEKLHQNTMKILQGYFTPTMQRQPDKTDPTTGELQSIGKYTQTGLPDTRGAMNYAYQEMPEYLKYGDIGQKYMDILKGFYNNNMTNSTQVTGNHTGRYILKRK